MLDYNSFLNELFNRRFEYSKHHKDVRYKSLSSEKSFEILNEYCKNYSLDNDQLYRGIPEENILGSPQYLLGDPTLYKRTSIETENIHTFIIDNDPQWKNYPKRSNCFDFGLSSDNIKQYSTDNAISYNQIYYVCIPFDNANIGFINVGNIWEAFHSTKLSRNGISLINYFFSQHNLLEYVNKYEFEALKNNMYTDSFYVSTYHNDMIIFIEKYCERHKELNYIIDREGGYIPGKIIFDAILEYFAPKSQFRNYLNIGNKDFKNIKYTKNFKIDHISISTAWTDSKTLFIRSDVWKKFKSKIK